MATLKITQVRSAIKRKSNQRKTLQALGIKRMNQTVEHTDSPQILGMINVVSHLVTVEQAS
jgi:large subunit ribosomal protein L30